MKPFCVRGGPIDRLDARLNGASTLARASRREARTAHEGEPGLPNADHRVALPVGERQYHIDLGPGELAEYILLPGDPDRTARIATRLDSIELERRNREFASVTGHVQGPAGFGRLDRHRHGQRRDRDRRDPGASPNGRRSSASARAARSSRRCSRATCASPPAPSGSRRRRASSSHDGYPAVADYEAVAGPRRGGEPPGPPPHVGITATAPGFFGAQGRPIPQLPIRYPDLAEDMARQRVLNFEMEASALLVLAGLAGVEPASCARYTLSGPPGNSSPGTRKDAAEAACVETGLEALRILADMDRRTVEAGADRWRPSLGM